MITLVKFYADWCQPCKAMAPTVDKLIKDKGFILSEVNIDDNPGLAKEHHVRSIPTLLLFENGTEIGRHTGQATFSKLEEWVNITRYGPTEENTPTV